MIGKHFRAGKLDAAFTAARYAPGLRCVGGAFFLDRGSVAATAAVGLGFAAVVLDWSRSSPQLRAARDKILGPVRKFRDAVAARIERIPIVFNFYPYGAGADFALGVNVLVNPFDVEFLFAAGRRTLSVSYVRKIPLVE